MNLRVNLLCLQMPPKAAGAAEARNSCSQVGMNDETGALKN